MTVQVTHVLMVPPVLIYLDQALPVIVTLVIMVPGVKMVCIRNFHVTKYSFLYEPKMIRDFSRYAKGY